MRDLYEATLYPGIGAFESTNLSVGRGTDTPFEQRGRAVDRRRAAGRGIERPADSRHPLLSGRFTPTSSKFAKEECGGVFMVITDRAALRPVRVGVEIASALVKLFPGRFEIDLAARLFGSTAGIARIKSGDDAAAIAQTWQAAEARWRLTRAKYLLLGGVWRGSVCDSGGERISHEGHEKHEEKPDRCEMLADGR